MTNLRHLDLGANAFLDPLPDLRSLVELRNFSIGLNRFVAPSFPTFFCQWSYIEVLDLGPNFFGGYIPPCLANLTSLVRLSIIRLNGAGTSISPIPPLHRLQRLEFLQIVGYGSAAPFPDWVTGLTSLQFLDLSRNQLEGPFPDLSQLRVLKVLKLDNNSLNGSIPPSLLSMGIFDVLSLSFNQFSGSFPDVLVYRVTYALLLTGNSLKGCISINQSQDVLVLNCDAAGNPQLCGCSSRICGIPACNSTPPVSYSSAPKALAPIPLSPVIEAPSASVLDSQNLVVVSPTLFSGDLRMNNSASLTIYVPDLSTVNLRDPILRVTGCVHFAGVLHINAPVSAAGIGEKRLIMFDRGYCDGFPRTFAYVRSTFDELDCTMAVVTKTVYDPHSVSVDFGPARNVCLNG
jgi:hypothetical protein